MALLKNLSPELQAERQMLVDTFVRISEEDEHTNEAFFGARAAIDEFDEVHELNSGAVDLFERLETNGFELVAQDTPWTVIDIHDLIEEKLGEDLDLEDTLLFSDLLRLFNQD